MRVHLRNHPVDDRTDTDQAVHVPVPAVDLPRTAEFPDIQSPSLVSPQSQTAESASPHALYAISEPLQQSRLTLRAIEHDVLAGCQMLQPESMTQ
ncbi:hypothetical protein D3C74_380080 [compost metagenome]